MLVRTNDLLPNVSGDHILSVNGLGIRGSTPTIAAKPKVAVLGGSTVEDWVLAEEETWPQQLASGLRECAPDIWVANLGKGGVNARHHLLQLPAIKNYMPQFDVFVVLMGLNDFLFDLRIHHPDQIPADWWGRQAFMTLPGDEGSSAIVALARRLHGRYSGKNNPSAAVSDFGNYQKHLRDAYAKVRREQWIDELPDISSHLETYQTTIRSLKAYADAYGAPVVFVTQPYVWSANMSVETRAQIFAGFIGHQMESSETKWYTPAVLQRGLAAYNTRLLETCMSDNLLCIDAAAALPRESQYFYDDFHFSEMGAAKLGVIVANALRRRGILCKS